MKKRILIIDDDSDSLFRAEKLLRREGIEVLEVGEAGPEQNASEGNYRRLVEQSLDLICEINSRGEFLFVNRRYRDLLGYAPEELLGRGAAELLHPDDLERAAAQHSRLGGELRESVDSWRFRHRNGEYRSFECRASVQGDGEGATTIVVSHDISERLEAERRRSVSETRFAAFMAHLPGSVFIKNSSDLLVFCNERYAQMVGSTPAELIGLPYADDLPEELSRQYREENRRVLTDGDILQTESSFPREGRPSHWLTCKFPLQVEGERFVGAVSIDITAQKLAEARLERAVEARERLMTELNHRIKNNLQMVGSLLNLKSEECGLDFSDIRQQIAAIRIVHENLTGRLGEEEIELAGYLSDLLDNLARIRREPDLTIIRELAPVCLNADTALHIGMIVNELVINAFKHGREPGRPLTVTVSLAIAGSEDQVRLTVGNDGRPFPYETVGADHSSLGLKLVEALARQLGGELRLEREPETRFYCEFPSRSPLCSDPA